MLCIGVKLCVLLVIPARKRVGILLRKVGTTRSEIPDKFGTNL